MKDGSTAIVACIVNDKMYVANTGDSRGVLCKSGKDIVLSEDHKPNLSKEKERIKGYGGKVEKYGEVWRINGNLAVSRAFGDFDFKDEETLGEKFLTVEPDILEFDIDEECEFIILACDGLWDVVTNEEAVNFVKESLKKYDEFKARATKDRNNDIYYTCMELAQLAREKGSKDNISCLIACFGKKDFFNNNNNNNQEILED